ncbi:MAG: hypothetical protein V4673_13695 [Pseudomonadota bacterium]
MKGYNHPCISIALILVLGVCLGATLIGAGTRADTGQDTELGTAKRMDETELWTTQSPPLDSDHSEEDGSQPIGSRQFAGTEYSISSTVPSAREKDSLELPFERRLMKGVQLPEGDMEDEMITNALSSNQPIKEYERESHVDPDPDIRSQTRIYSLAAEQAILASQTPVRLDGLACGSRICMGVISGGSEKDYTDWAFAFSQRPEAIGLGLTSVVAADKQRRTSLRFAFTTQPFLYAR